MMEKSKRLLAMLLFIFVSLAMFGQGATTSSMNGKVVDITGKALAGATVVATHVPSGTLYGATANSEGYFLMQGMRPGGPYKVEASFVGYSKKTYTDITLFLGETFSLNPDLTESSTELNEVVVTGLKGSAFNTVKTGATMNISNTQITALPSISRSINDFTRLSPLAGGSNSFAGRDGRYNNIVIDGSNFNNNFGLSSRNMPGGDAEPVSLDAIEEIQVNVAPYDVRQANFTGAGINAITKRGTNSYSASVYGYYRDQSFNGQKVGSYELPAAASTSTKIIGARVGGPIIKDKLFFFLNGEYESSTVPGMEWKASRKGTADSIGAPNVSRTAADSLLKFSNLLQSKYGYATGPFENYGAFAVENFKILGRIDWNISQKHKFSLRFNAVRSTNNQIVNGTSAPNPRATSSRVSQNAMSYQNTNYGFLNTVYSLSAELNSNFTNAISNQVLGTFTMIQDTRTSPSQSFPFIDIWDGAGDAYMSAGYELFTFNNNVANNVFTITDNVTYKTGRHNFTAGATFEYLYFGNSYMRYGTSYYRFKDLQTFVNHTNGVAGNQPIAFGITYSFDPANSKPVAELGFGQLSAYGQDEYNILDNLKLTYGIRFDVPLYMNDLLYNKAIGALKFQNYDTLNHSEWPKSKIIPSPRIGFNWDVFKDKRLKVRGGTGIFTGRLPFVWFTNIPTNSGMLQNTVELTSAATLDSIKFSADPFGNRNATNWNASTQKKDPLFPTVAGKASPSSIAGVDRNFKMPQVWRTSLAADIRLPFDMTLTLEGMYTKDINAIIQQNVNLPQPYGATPYNGPDKRPVWPTTASRKINSALSEAMLLTNTNQGYSWNFTAQLAFPVVKNLNGTIAYSAMMARDISGNPGSQAASAWSGNLSVRGQNDLDMSYSQYLTPHRVVGSLNYKIDYLKHMSTSIAIFYNAYIDGNFSYKYSNDFNNDGVNGDLLYIPKNQSEITFETYTSTTTKITYTAEQQASAYWAYVGQDKYLSSHLGQYAERNGAFYPWYHRFDVKILQDFYIDVKGKKNTLQLSCDILNAANLLNSDWGIRQRLTTSSGALLTTRAVSNNLLYKMVEAGGKLPTKTFDNVNTTSSTWGIQIGLRYIFN